MAGGMRASRSARAGTGERTGTRAHAPQAYNGAVREQLADLQRARIVAAALDVAAQGGAGSVTVAHIVERSGVSRRTFYENFSDREDCLLASFERALTLASRRVLPAYEAGEGWRERIRAGLVSFLAFCDEKPTVAQMLVCESQTSGPRVSQRRAEILNRLTRIVDQGRTLTGTPKGRIPRGHAAAGKSGKAENLSPLAAEGTVGGVLAVIQARLAACPRTGETKPEPLVALTNELMSMIVLPYLGAPAARRELKRAAPAPSSEAIERTPLGDPFKEAGMRLTYRTVRVLMATAEHPGASNRLIADTAEITDQGQISKLLGRLKRAGMLTNTGLGAGKGAPNAWSLTENGERIAQSIRANTEGSRSRGARER
jgi:AcrR family transcriptional regulator/DNA-binding MarR family transcriptional regulator